MFNKYFMCHFQENVQIDNIENAHLRKIWKCEHTRADVERICQNWRESLENNEEMAELTNEQAEELFCNLIELVLIFLQYNFTGPFPHLQDYKNVILEMEFKKQYNPIEKLSANGEEVNSNVQLGEFLVLAKVMLNKLLLQFPDNLYLHWWHLRIILVQQHALDNLASDLYEWLKQEAERLMSYAADIMDMEERQLLLLEIANGYLQFHRFQKCEQILDILCKTLNVVLEVKGLLGLRTKFQKNPLPQLCLQVRQEESSIEPEYSLANLPKASVTHGSTKLPKLLLLDDDTRLERIKFIEPQDDEAITIPSVLQALVLTKVKCLKRSQPDDRLRDEQIEPYVQTLVYQQQGPLQVRVTALLLNCAQESKQHRTVERSWKQCEEIVKLVSDESETAPTLFQRLSYAFVAHLETHWGLQFQLCDLLLSLGLTKTALDIYLRLEAWHQVIECYNRLELNHKAAEIISQQIAIKPTVLLYCLLGNATEDPKHYETAWKFSGEKSGKAQAFWGNYYFRRHNFEEALPHLRLAVEINALQELVWLRLGYSAMVLQDWQLAVHSYMTYTHLEPNGFEAWNNCAKALIKLGDKVRAHKILQDALKCNYNNWKVWENFMLVSLDTGHFEDTLNAYSRLTELKQRFFDLEVLRVLITAIAVGKPDARGQTQEKLIKKATTLLGQQCIAHSSESELWELATLIAGTPLKKAQKMNRAYRAFVGVGKVWASKHDLSLKALQLCRELCQHSLKAMADREEGETLQMAISQLNSARITAHGCLHAVEENLGSIVENCDEHRAIVEEIKEILEQFKVVSEGKL